MAVDRRCDSDTVPFLRLLMHNLEDVDQSIILIERFYSHRNHSLSIPPTSAVLERKRWIYEGQDSVEPDLRMCAPVPPPSNIAEWRLL